MPATYQGNATPSVVTSWHAATNKSLGDLIATASGLIMMAVVGGTTGGTQPTWGLPTIGTTFTDGSVTWAMRGFEPGAYRQGPVIQLAVDGDPDIAGAETLPFETLADWVAFLNVNTAFLGYPNTWTNSQTFDGGDAGGISPATQTLVAPAPRVKIWQGYVDSGGTIFARLYTDSGISGSYSETNGIDWTINAYWNGSHWAQDDATKDSLRVIIGFDTFSVLTQPAGTAAWAEGAWVQSSIASFSNANSFWAMGVPLSATQLGLSGPVNSVGGHQTKGRPGVKTCLANTSNNAAGTSSSMTTGITTATNLLGSGGAGLVAPFDGLYEIEFYGSSTSSTPPNMTCAWYDEPYNEGFSGGNFNLTQVGIDGSSRYFWTGSVRVFCKAGGTLNLLIAPVGGQTCTAFAACSLIC